MRKEATVDTEPMPWDVCLAEDDDEEPSEWCQSSGVDRHALGVAGGRT